MGNGIPALGGAQPSGQRPTWGNRARRLLCSPPFPGLQAQVARPPPRQRPRRRRADIPGDPHPEGLTASFRRLGCIGCLQAVRPPLDCESRGSSVPCECATTIGSAAVLGVAAVDGVYNPPPIPADVPPSARCTSLGLNTQDHMRWETEVGRADVLCDPSRDGMAFRLGGKDTYIVRG